jgi:hypothetical protein
MSRILKDVLTERSDWILMDWDKRGSLSHETPHRIYRVLTTRTSSKFVDTLLDFSGVRDNSETCNESPDHTSYKLVSFLEIFHPRIPLNNSLKNLPINLMQELVDRNYISELKELLVELEI